MVFTRTFPWRMPVDPPPTGKSPRPVAVARHDIKLTIGRFACESTFALLVYLACGRRDLATGRLVQAACGYAPRRMAEVSLWECGDHLRLGRAPARDIVHRRSALRPKLGGERTVRLALPPRFRSASVRPSRPLETGSTADVTDQVPPNSCVNLMGRDSGQTGREVGAVTC